MREMIQHFIETYGYAAVVVGTFLEGETIVILAAVAAYSGYLKLEWVIAAAFGGSLCGDQLFFYLGRTHYQLILSKRPYWRDRIDKAHRMLERFRTPFVLIFRFLYGLRTVAPFMIGMSNIATKKFVVLNIIGAAIWATTIGVAGFYLGNAIESLLGNIKKYELWLLGAIALIGFSLWVFYLYRRRKARNK